MYYGIFSAVFPWDTSYTLLRLGLNNEELETITIIETLLRHEYKSILNCSSLHQKLVDNSFLYNMSGSVFSKFRIFNCSMIQQLILNGSCRSLSTQFMSWEWGRNFQLNWKCLLQNVCYSGSKFLAHYINC